ncbi:MAG: hypothetical protein GEU97_06670 [Actinophytocola sp.]|nr:hypothetical protein [Actinophytocola sp.]
MRSVSSVTLPAELVQEPGNLPDHCSRHGRPAAKQADFPLPVKKRPASSASLTNNAFSAASKATDRAKRPRALLMKGWPLCQACVHSRTMWLTTTFVLFFGGLVAFFGALGVQIALDDPPVNTLALLAMIGFVAMVAAALPSYLASHARLTKATPTPDGDSVIVIDPSDEFRSGLPV